MLPGYTQRELIAGIGRRSKAPGGNLCLKKAVAEDEILPTAVCQLLGICAQKGANCSAARSHGNTGVTRCSVFNPSTWTPIRSCAPRIAHSQRLLDFRGYILP